MKPPCSATIYLADHYQTLETATARSIEVFTPQRPACTGVRELMDCTLAAQCSQEHPLTAGSILLPLVGGLTGQFREQEWLIPCGEILVFHETFPLRVANPYEAELVNYLILRLDQEYRTGFGVSRYSFDLDAAKNEMQELFHHPEWRVSIGKFEMRREDSYRPCSRSNPCFCFVIQGSFEIEGRLLHARDSLAIWDTDQLEIESLGPSSLLILLEQTNQQS